MLELRSEPDPQINKKAPEVYGWSGSHLKSRRAFSIGQRCTLRIWRKKCQMKMAKRNGKLEKMWPTLRNSGILYPFRLRRSRKGGSGSHLKSRRKAWIIKIFDKHKSYEMDSSSSGDKWRILGGGTIGRCTLRIWRYNCEMKMGKKRGKWEKGEHWPKILNIFQILAF